MTEKPVTPAIGIDLGYQESCVGVWHQDKVEIIKNEGYYSTTSSIVAFTPTECLIGDAANIQWTTNLANTIYESQRLVGRRFNDPEVQKDIQRLNDIYNKKWWNFKVIKGGYGLPKYLVEYKGKEKEYSPEEISSMVLVELKNVAESDLGTTVKEAVIAVPAYFNDSQREATKVAAHLAGLNVLQIVDGPVLAAIAYNGLDTNAQDKNVFIFDLKYDTFDVSLVTINGKGNFTVKARGGDTRFGGWDLVKLLCGHFVKEFNSRHEIDLTGDSRALVRLRTECNKVIRDLSSATQTTVNIDDLKHGIDFSTNISRSEFEQISESFYSKCIEAVESCIRDAKINKTDVDDIVLVGHWTTTIPKLQHMLEEFNGKKLLKSIHGDHVVAHGATILATKLSREKNEIPKSLPLLLTIPLSLGVDAPDGVFSVIIPRNTPIPAHKQSIYITTSDNQNNMSFNVYQGERSRAKDNDWLGKFEVAVSLAPKGKSKVKVVFNIDDDGILNCWVKEFTTRLKRKIIINNYKQKLSKEKIETMLKDEQKYKMEDLEYKKIMCARSVLEEYIYNVKRKMEKIGSTDKTRLHAEKIKKMENDIEVASIYLNEKPEATDIDEHQRVLSELEKVCVAVISQLV